MSICSLTVFVIVTPGTSRARVCVCAACLCVCILLCNLCELSCMHVYFTAHACEKLSLPAMQLEAEHMLQNITM